jgi:hypothetical protein
MMALIIPIIILIKIIVISVGREKAEQGGRVEKNYNEYIMNAVERGFFIPFLLYCNDDHNKGVISVLFVG